ncbi:MAG: YczE/YyaS/YitT family protein [Gammaproteobacteria bacterium]
MLRIFSVGAVPRLSWSSAEPLELRPAPVTLASLFFGLILFGLGEALLIAAHLGVSPWTVLAQGLVVQFGGTIGLATFIVSVLVLVLWLPLRQKPGIGTVLNAVIIAAVIDLSLPVLPSPESFPGQMLQVVVGVLLVGLGSGFYLTANLGPGPRDGLMTGLQRLLRWPIASIRIGIEITVVTLGWSLGGTVGLGTLIFALGVGPAVALGILMVERVSEFVEAS